MLKRFDMDKPGLDPPLAIPADPNAKLSRAQCPTNPVDQARMKNLKYSSIVGSILFACVCTRPDIANATRDVCRYMHNPGMPHYRAARRILRYLKGTQNLGITLGGSTNSIERFAYSDSSYAPCIDTRRSVTGFVTYWNYGPVSWESRTQPTVSKSTAEAEYYALGEAISEMLWNRQIATDLHIPTLGPDTVFEDNQAAVALAYNPRHKRRTKHIDVRWHFIRQYIKQGDITVPYCPTSDMVADILTKNLVKAKFMKLRPQLMGHKPHAAKTALAA